MTPDREASKKRKILDLIETKPALAADDFDKMIEGEEPEDDPQIVGALGEDEWQYAWRAARNYLVADERSAQFEAIQRGGESPMSVMDVPSTEEPTPYSLQNPCEDLAQEAPAEIKVGAQIATSSGSGVKNTSAECNAADASLLPDTMEADAPPQFACNCCGATESSRWYRCAGCNVTLCER